MLHLSVGVGDVPGGPEMKTIQYSKIQPHEIYIVRGAGATGICEKGMAMFELMQMIIEKGGVPTYELLAETAMPFKGGR